jgi:penicillin-binding protein 2
MTLLSPRRDVGEFRKRYKWMFLITLVTFAVLIARMAQLQLLEYDYWAKQSRENITKTIALPATRGVLRDTDGRIVADNRPSFNVYITPQMLDPDGDVERIAKLMGLDEEQKKAFQQRLEDVPQRRRAHQIEMFSDISRDQLAALKTHSSELPGLDVVAVPRRTYPYDSLGAHAIGYLNEVSAKEIEKHEEQNYRPGDRIGRSGIERAWESYLRGRRGYLRVPVDSQGRLHEAGPLADIKEERKPPVPGRDLTLTLDMKLMESIQRAFRGHPTGGVVVAEVDTGRVRALYSKPAYDLNEMSSGLSQERYDELKSNPFRPLIDKTVYETYFPGSTFKPFAALTALEEGDFPPSERVDCRGYYKLGNRKFRCTHMHGEVGMRSALIQSCNVYFYQLGQKVGIDRLAHYAREFGLGTPTGIGINTETSGFIASRDWYIEQYGSPYRLGFTLNAAIGQGNTKATLIQMAMAYAAMGNGGKIYVPQLVESVQDPDGNVIEEFKPRIRRKTDVSKDHLDFVLESLHGVVADREGTAHNIYVEDGVSMAGKTGTAQVSQTTEQQENSRKAWYFNRDHAWFVGLAPHDDPKVVIVVLVEHGGPGGKTAAPIAKKVLQKYLGGSQKKAAGKSKGDVLASTGER